MCALYKGCFLSFLMLPALSLASDQYPHVRVEKAPVPVSGTPAPANGAGLRVYVDPKTGERTANPSEEQRQALDQQILEEQGLGRNADAFYNVQGLVEEVTPSGAVMIRLDGRIESVVSAQVGEDGKRHVACTDPLHQMMSAHEHDITAPSDNSDER